MSFIEVLSGVLVGIFLAIFVDQRNEIAKLKEELAQERADKEIKLANRPVRVPVPNDANTL